MFVIIFDVVFEDILVSIDSFSVWVLGNGKFWRLRFCVLVCFWRFRVMVSFIMVLLFVLGGRFSMLGRFLVLSSRVLRWLVVFVIEGIFFDGWFGCWVGIFGVV